MIKKKRADKKRRFRIRYIFFLLIFLYGISIFISQQGMIKELAEKKSMKEKEINTLKQDLQDIEGIIKYAHTPEYIEKIARDELGMVKPLEIIFIDKNRNKFVKGLKD